MKTLAILACSAVLLSVVAQQSQEGEYPEGLRPEPRQSPGIQGLQLPDQGGQGAQQSGLSSNNTNLTQILTIVSQAIQTLSNDGISVSSWVQWWENLPPELSELFRDVKLGDLNQVLDDILQLISSKDLGFDTISVRSVKSVIPDWLEKIISLIFGGLGGGGGDNA